MNSAPKLADPSAVPRAVGDQRAKGSRRSQTARPAIGLLVLAALCACKASDRYAHMGIDISVDGLSPGQKKLLSDIHVTSEPEGNTDPARVFRFGVKAADLDANSSAHTDYIPSPQSGTFVVTAALFDSASEQLAIKSQKAKLVAGKTAKVTLDFVSELSPTGACRPEAEPVQIGRAHV